MDAVLGDPGPHFGKLDEDPDPHQSEKVEALAGSTGGSRSGKK
jgi:hypothetical protein